MNEKRESQKILEKIVSDDLLKVEIKARQLQYKMDFGENEVAIKIGLN